MNWREWLADLISGGALTFHKNGWARSNALYQEAKADADELRLWRDVVLWTDDGQRTLFDWFAGGGHEDGEFSHFGLRRETPQGETLFRRYRAVGPWERSTIKAKEAANG